MLPTCLFVSHAQRESLEGDAAAPALDGGRVHPQEQCRIGGKSAGQQLGTARRYVDKKLVVGVGEHLHVELLLEARAESFATIDPETVLSLVRCAAVLRRVRWA